MRPTSVPRDLQLIDRLTTIKLAVQLLDRQPGRTAYEHHLVETAVQAVNQLATDLLLPAGLRPGLPDGSAGPTR